MQKKCVAEFDIYFLIKTLFSLINSIYRKKRVIYIVLHGKSLNSFFWD